VLCRSTLATSSPEGNKSITTESTAKPVIHRETSRSDSTPPGMSGSARALDGTGRASHYYVAVGSADAKLITLVELLQAFAERSPFGVALCCRSRDKLDAMLGGLLQGGFSPASVFCLYSDMGELERSVVLQSFQAALGEPCQGADMQEEEMGSSPPAGDMWEMEGISPRQWEAAPGGRQRARRGAQVMALTDVCLKTSGKQLQAAGVQLLVNFDMPTRKELYQRRLSCLPGAKGGRSARGGAVVHLVVAGEVAAFRTIETYTLGTIMHAPVEISEILGGATAAEA